ncbi:MAG: MBL fold metallo-hydrolase [Austwickia sp.]|nr:MBL fold metallo-hydrolase [Austwickia sp.]
MSGAPGSAPVPRVPRPASWDPKTWTGGVWSEYAECVLCPNPSPMTLEGTNTWVLGAPDRDEVLVVDPGPLDEAHLRRVLGRIGDRRVVQTLLTHGHPDHAEGGARFAELTGAPVRAIGTGHDDLADGDSVAGAGVELLVVATPGHTADSISFCLTVENALLTGDTVLGWGTTVVAWPDGVLHDYLASLERIAALTGSGRVTDLLPGHGGPIADAAGIVRYYREHRAERLQQIRAALAHGARGVEAVVETVYADVDRSLWPAASLSVRAQLDYLGEPHGSPPPPIDPRHD